MHSLTFPVTKQDIANLKAGDIVSYSGKMLVMRDAAHEKIYNLLKKGSSLPIDLNNALIYYMGPCPAANGQIIGSAGPTTAKRMDAYAPTLYDMGVIATIGKGGRDRNVLESIKKNRALYMVAVGGAGAYYSKCIKSEKVIAYPELLSEAILEIEVVDFKMLVAIDSQGNTL